jgi:uncharacterized protein YjiS (DUF1127 family)
MSCGHCGYPTIRPSDWLSLTPAEKAVLTRRFIRRVQKARSRAIGGVLLGWTHFLSRRQRMRDLATLSAMDDLELRDIGVNRCEIRRAVQSGTDLKPAR